MPGTKCKYLMHGITASMNSRHRHSKLSKQRVQIYGIVPEDAKERGM